MRAGSYREAKIHSLDFTARFGFLTQELFFKYLTRMGKSTKYTQWANLRKEGLIASSRSSKEVFYLTKKGRRLYRKPSAPARSIYFIEHDIFVAHILLSLQKAGLVHEYWTERELLASKGEAHSAFGTAGITKYPDLLVDLSSQKSTLRIAFEVERSRKAQSRYDQIARQYLNAIGIDFIIFGCTTEATSRAIERAFDGEAFQKAAKVPVLFLLDEFEKVHFQAKCTIMGRTLTLKQLLLTASDRPPSDWPDDLEKDWNTFQENSNKTKRAG